MMETPAPAGAQNPAYRACRKSGSPCGLRFFVLPLSACPTAFARRRYLTIQLDFFSIFVRNWHSMKLLNMSLKDKTK
nr:MAG TPA: hypothetical protein [Caudoviricetes sp.]